MATSSEANKPPEPVTGYPVTYVYVAPPPPTQPQVVSSAGHYQSHQEDRQTGTQWPPLLCRLLIITIVIVAVMGAASFITWLIVDPQFPEFRVDSASISQLRSSSVNLTLSAMWQVSIRVKNPNKKVSLFYNTLEASVFYEEWELDSTLVPSFSQEKGSETHVDFQLGVLSEYVDKSVTRGIDEEKQSGAVEFGVRVLGWVRFKAGWWSMGWRYLRVDCDGVMIGVTDNGRTAGNLVGPVNPCRVGK